MTTLAIAATAAPASAAAGSHAPTAAGTGAASAVGATRTPGATDRTPRTVTLITGDRVTVGAAAGDLTAVTVRGPGGRASGARITTVGTDTYVYPDAAVPYVAAGLLDEDLFNVTRLLADGYDDAHTDRLPLIVSYTDAAARSRTQAVPAGAERVRGLESIQGAALTARRDRAAEFWAGLTGTGPATTRAKAERPGLAAGISKVWLDGKVRAALADTTAQIGAPAVWSGGNTGVGVPVAVLDTGVDLGHPDLVGRVAESASFVPGEEVTDRNGHGTHVASTIAGSGAASGGAERGVAPGAELHVGKVLDDTGGGQDSWIIAGMEWAARDQHAKVISMSLGGAPTDGTDPLSQAVDRLSAETGALFTIAAGNSGPDMQMVGAPGAADAALTVGAVDSLDRLAVFSSRGPRRGDNGLKPELTAPGVDVLAARSQYAAEGEGYYQTMSGTSMATPHVAGAAALLAAAHPDWTGSQLKDALVSTTKITQRYDAYFAGSGRLDVSAAVAGTVFASGTVFTDLDWPYAPGQRVDQEVTYTNTGDAPVTLDLRVNAPTAPAGLFTLPAGQVTVPARGTSTVVVAVDLDLLADDKYSSGMVVATGPSGAPSVHTVVGINKEGERVDLTLKTRGPDGKALAGTVMIKDIVRDVVPRLYPVDASGTLEVSLPPSTYSAWMYADVPGAGGPYSLGRAVLAEPEIELSRDSTVTLDGRRLHRVEAIAPQVTATAQVRLDYFRSYPGRYPLADNYVVGHEYDSVWAASTGAKVSKGTFTFRARWSLVQPPLAVTANGQTFDDLLIQSGSVAFPDGRQRLDAVFAGQGAPADYDRLDVRGKVAVVRANDAVGALDQADAAAAAGAKLLLLVNNGVGRLDAWYEVADPRTPLPVASLGRDRGEELVARLGSGRTALTVEAHHAPEYVYDLVRRYNGAIPADLSYRPTRPELARVDVAFRHHRSGEGVGLRFDVSPDQPHSALSGAALPIPTQGVRTDWVTADQHNRWMELAVMPELTQTSSVVSYAGGERTDVTWFAPVARPRVLATGLTSPPVRSGEEVVVFDLPPWGDSDPHHQGMPSVAGFTQTTRLYQGDQLLAESPGGILSAPVGPDPVTLRLVTETAQDGAVLPYSTRTRTEWGFTSAPAAEGGTATLPLIQVDYQVTTDASGRAGRRAELTVAPVRLGAVAGSAGIRGVTVELSYDDGVTWQATSLSRTTDGWRTSLRAPASATFASVRTTARDGQGNTVSQTVVRAFGIR
ncbi:S8 family serine peptidase [Micromonospora pisi]|uniref:S8 family serine peptidase n=1 Tax=Micromonospora pisi TaxID=589240 RepID=UPI001B87F5B0|nr:S8 family serine peptidase [Micromonospora pisi]